MGLQTWIKQFAILVALSSACFAQPLAQPLGAVHHGAPNRVKLDDLRGEGYAALFSLDYETANRVFEEMTRVFPDHAAGPQ